MAQPEIVGRADEVAQLARFIEDLPERSSALIISGEPGIGKTRLWTQALKIARSRAMAVLSTRPIEAEAQFPFAGLDDLLSGVPDEVLTELTPPQRHVLEVALLRREDEGHPLKQRAVSVAVREVLVRLAHRSPVVVAIDDLQWLDPPTTRVLRFAIRRLEREPIGLLVSVRSDRAPRPPLGLDRIFIEDHARRLDVGPLSEAALDQLLRSRLGYSFPRSLLGQLQRTSGGNPLFALEIGRALMGRDLPIAPGGILPVPDSLQELVSDRLFRLPGAVRDLLLAVAALARPTIALIRRAQGDTEQTSAALQRAVDAGVVELEPDRIRFTHPLFASAMYTAATFEQRRVLHRRLAEVVTDVEEQAQHLALTTDEPSAEVAALLDAAARRARARGAPDAAAALAEQARRLTPEGASEDILRRSLETADGYIESGDTERARELLERLIAATPPGRARAETTWSLGRVSLLDRGPRTAADLLEGALEEAGDDPALTAKLERDLCMAILQSDDVRRAEPHARAALDLAEKVGDPLLTLSSLTQLAMVRFLLGQGIDGESMERAEALENDIGPVLTGAVGFLPIDLIWGGLLKWADEFDEARARFENLRKRASHLGEESTWISLLFQHGELELWAGNWEQADTYARRALEIASRFGHEGMHQDCLYLAAACRAHMGDVDAARELATTALDEAHRRGDLRFSIRSLSVMGSVELSLGEHTRARPYFDRAVEEYFRAGYGDPGVIRFLPDAIEVDVALGEFARAETLLVHLEERAAALDRPVIRAAALRCRGLLAAAMGDLAGGLRALETALDAQRDLNRPLEEARTLLCLGAIRRRAKQKRSARDALEEAIEKFDGLSARRWSERAHDELGRISGRSSTASRLSPTEERVAELAVAGYTNKEVADRLFMSVKTVEANLTRIYAKAGVRSRRELARLRQEDEIERDLPGPRNRGESSDSMIR